MKARPFSSVHYRSQRTNRINTQDQQNKQHKKSKTFRSRTYDRNTYMKSALKIDKQKINKNVTFEDDQSLRIPIPKGVFRTKKHHPFDQPSILSNIGPKHIEEIKPFRRNISQRNHQNNRSQDVIISRPRMYKMYQYHFKVPQQCLDPSQKEQKYTSQLKSFSQLSIRIEELLTVLQTSTNSIDISPKLCSYNRYINDKHLQFIDKFLLKNKNQKIIKTIRNSRINETLSICYLFLEVAQDRFKDNQSALINFIGFCCNNIKLIIRLYILLNKKLSYKRNQLEQIIQKSEIKDFRHVLHNLEYVVLRIQHNNEIIGMIHKKLGKNNQKFQNYIKQFLKIAERKKHPSSFCAHYIFQYLAMYIHEEGQKLLNVSHSLEIAPSPYLPAAQKPYTLVFEPLGVLKAMDSFELRPYLMQFIKWASKYFDLVMWTWQMPSQMESIEQLLEPYLFSKLYRYHCIHQNQIYIKDLRRLGRNLSQTIIIDYDERIFEITPQNGLVSRWNSDNKQDKGLLLICEVLQEMVSNSSSVYQTLDCYMEQLRTIRT